MEATKVKTKEKFVIDACAMLAYLNNESGSSVIEQVLKRAERHEVKIFITIMDLAEIYHLILKEAGREKAIKSIVLLRNLPVESMTLDESLLMIAGELRMQYPLTLGDAFVAAVAKSMDAKIITGDKDFKAIEKEIGIIWI